MSEKGLIISKPIALSTICAIIIGIIIFWILSSFNRVEGYSNWLTYMKGLTSGKAPNYDTLYGYPGTQAGPSITNLPGVNMSPIGRHLQPYRHMGRLYSKSNANDKQLILQGRPNIAQRHKIDYRVIDPKSGIPIKLNVKKIELYDNDELTIPGYSGKFIVEIEEQEPVYNPYVF